MAGEFRQADIARRLQRLWNEIGQLSARIKSLENSASFADDPALEQLPSRHIFYPVIVTTVSTMTFQARICIPTSASSPWTIDTSIATSLTVFVPPDQDVPRVDEILCVQFTGTYGANYAAVYGWFDPVRQWQFGKLDGELSPSGVATVSIYEWSGSAWTDTGRHELGYAPPIFAVGTIPSAKWVFIDRHRQAKRFYVLGREC